MESPLHGLSDDVLILIYSFLDPPTILRVSSTCKRLQSIGYQKIVWTNACNTHLVVRGFPSPPSPLSLSASTLRHETLAAYYLAQRWKSGVSSPLRRLDLPGLSGSLISDLRILPGQDVGSMRLLTMSKNIWMEMSVWEVFLDDVRPARRLGRWSPRGALYNGLAVNTDTLSEATIALSIYLDGEFSVKLMKLGQNQEPQDFFHVLNEFPSTKEYNPVAFEGDIVALADSEKETILWNWKANTFATLDTTSDNIANVCHQVVFAHESVLVIRARSVQLFDYPEFKSAEQFAQASSESPAKWLCIAGFSFGWLDGVSAAICPYIGTKSDNDRVDPPAHDWPSIYLLNRGENDDPWADHAHQLDVYALDPNPHFIPPTNNSDADSENTLDRFAHPSLSRTTGGHSDDEDLNDPYRLTQSPYIVPPQPAYFIPARRGSLLCRKLILGRYGTAVWIEPQEQLDMGLVANVTEVMNGLANLNAADGGVHFRWQDEDRIRTESCLKIVAFPGPLAPEELSRDGDPDTGLIHVGSHLVGRSASQQERSRRRIRNIPSKTFLTDDQNDWTAFDYDEVKGRIVVGTSGGKVIVLEI